MLGIMNVTVELLGTSLAIKAGTIVKLTPATNLPAGRGEWFARPARPGATWMGHGDDSILIDSEDVRITSIDALLIQSLLSQPTYPTGR